MSARRVADLHRELARVHAALADAIEGDAKDAPSPEKAEDRPSRPRKKRPVTDIEKARARKALRRVGLDV